LRSAATSSGDITAGWTGIVVFSPAVLVGAPRKSVDAAPGSSQGGIVIRSAGSRKGA
jgi:hypothetical protein